MKYNAYDRFGMRVRAGAEVIFDVLSGNDVDVDELRRLKIGASAKLDGLRIVRTA